MLPEWAAEYVGWPYRPGGRSRDGVDCWGLLLLVWRERFGFHAPVFGDVSYLGRNDTDLVARSITEGARSLCDAVPCGEEQAGDACLLRLRGHPLHIGLCVTPGMMLHATDSAGSVIESYRGVLWEKRVLSWWRPRFG